MGSNINSTNASVGVNFETALGILSELRLLSSGLGKSARPIRYTRHGKKEEHGPVVWGLL